MNTGPSDVNANWVLNLAPSSEHEANIRYDSEIPITPNNYTISNNGQTFAFSFDWTIGANDPAGPYDLLGAIRDAGNWNSVLETTATGANTTAFDWLNGFMIDNAGNSTSQARNLGTLAPASYAFSDWIGTGDTDDYYKIHLDGTTDLSLSLVGLSADADLFLLDSGGTEIDSSDYSGSVSESISKQVGAGDYYIHVQRWSGDTTYTLGIEPTPNNAISGTIVDGNDTFNVSIQRHDIQDGVIDPGKPTWLIIHGLNSNIHGSGSDPDSFDDLISAIQGQRPDDQILSLDWETAAQADDGDSDTFNDVERRIPLVADEMGAALISHGFLGGDAGNLNLIGHSFGAYVAGEIAEIFGGGVDTIVALDPAENVLSPYNPGGAEGVNFARDSQFSWAFHANPTIFDKGHEDTPTTAHEAFVANDTTHAGIVDLFTSMLNDPNGEVGQHFQLERLVNHTTGLWVENQFNHYGSSGGGYEAVIETTSDGTVPVSITPTITPQNVGDPPTSITPGTGTWVWGNPFGDTSESASIGTGNEFDIYRFTADQTGNYVISATGGYLDSQIRIYDSSGTAITGIIDADTSAGGGESTTQSLSGGSWYYVAVGGYQTGTGAYTLSVNGPSLPTDSISTPGPTYTGSTNGTINYGGDLDYYTITAPSGTSSLDLSVTPVAGLNSYVELYNSSGSLLQTISISGAGNADTATGIATSAGATYYVGVSGFSSTGTGNFTVNADFNPDQINNAPVVSNPIADQVATEDQAFTFQVLSNAFTDIDGDSLTYTTSALPAGMTFDATTRTFNWRPGNADVGSYSISVTASDGLASATDTFILTVNNVNDAPVVSNPIADQVATEDQPFTLQVLSNAFTDIDGDSLTYTTSALPADMTFDATTRTFNWTPDNADVGSYSIDVTASDGLASATDTFLLTVTDVNDAPTGIALDNVTVSENLTGAVIGNLTVSDPDVGDAHTFSVSDARFEVVGGQLKLKTGVSLDFESEPTVTVDVTATDTGGLSFAQAFNISVSDVNEAPTDLSLDNNTVDEDAAFGTVVGQITTSDPDGQDDSFTYSLVDNAGGLFAIDSDSGVITVAHALDYEAASSHDIRVQVIDSGGLSYEESFSLGVLDKPDDDDVLHGGPGSDILIGGSGSDTLYGDEGDDFLIGGFADDILVGGPGDDLFRFDAGDGNDTINDFIAGAGTDDVIDLTDIAEVNTFTDVEERAIQVGIDTEIALGEGDSITLIGVSLSDLHQDDFLF